MANIDPPRDHLFISYATEDLKLAEWLTLKLTSQGYLVWCDKIKLLGGESYPKDIDDAIKNQTFRFIALLSRTSIQKDNPRKERTLALNIAKELNEDFIIPINVDGLSSTELDWMHSDLTYILFKDNWANGLRQLLKKLEKINAPKPLQKGKEIAANYFLNYDYVKNETEILHSNCLNIKRIPQVLKKFKIRDFIDNDSFDIMSRSWAFYLKGRTAFAFHTPPTFALIVDHVTDIEWQKYRDVEGVLTKNIISSLIKKSLDVKLYEKGIKREKIEKKDRLINGKFYFPPKLLEDNKIRFKDYKGRKIALMTCGTRSKTRLDGTVEYYNYHLAPNFIVKQGLIHDYSVLLKVELYITDKNGLPLQRRSYNSRRKIICRSWWNHQWLTRLMAILSFLSNESGDIIIGGNTEEQLILDSKLVAFESPQSIIETELQELSDADGTHLDDIVALELETDVDDDLNEQN